MNDKDLILYVDDDVSMIVFDDIGANEDEIE